VATIFELKGWELRTVMGWFIGAPPKTSPDTYGSIKPSPPAAPKPPKRDGNAKFQREKDMAVELAEEQVKRAELELKQCTDSAQRDILRMWNVGGHSAVYRKSKGGLEAHLELPGSGIAERERTQHG
jgi:hypothetical protein